MKGPTIVARWDGECLTYAAPIDLAALRKMEPCLFILKPYKGASEKQMRFANALAHRAAENSAVPTSRDRIMHEVKHRYGWFTNETVVEGDRVIVEVRSMADLDREELSRFIEQLIVYICDEVCPGMDPSALRREAEGDAAPYRGGGR